MNIEKIDFKNLTNKGITLVCVGGAVFITSNVDKAINTLSVSQIVIASVLVIFGIIVFFLESDKKSSKPKHKSNKVNEENFDRVFSVKEAIEFYDLVAPYYDKRNTNSYYTVYDKIQKHILNNVNFVKKKYFLDVGGGTAKLFEKFIDYNLDWHSLEGSSKMIEVSRKNTNIVNRDNFFTINHLINQGELSVARTFDVVIMNFFLSSYNGAFMRDRLFSNIYDLLSNDGLFIIADADPIITLLNNNIYGFEDIGDKHYALKIRSINTENLVSEVLNHNFKLLDTDVSTHEDTSNIYARIHIFKKD